MSPAAASRVRIGDAERDAAATSLGDHFAAGRLTRQEFDERLEQAWAAKTADELKPLFVDLPGEPAAVRVGRADAVGFGDARRQVDQRRGPSGRPPIFLILMAVAIALTIITSVPIIFIVLGFLWFTGMLRHCGRSRRSSWSSR